jgi:hypothetical protein
MNRPRYLGTRAQRLAAKRARVSAWKRRVLSLPLLGVGSVIVFVAVTGASAFWTLGGIGAATETVGQLGAPTDLATTVNGTTIHLSWSGSAPPGSGSLGYIVDRFSGTDGYATSSPAGGTCTSSLSQLLPGTVGGCDDSGLAPGDYEYRVTTIFRTWTASSTLTSPSEVFRLDHFEIVIPNSTTAGAAVTLTVTAEDAAGQTIPSFVGTVHFTSTDPNATLPSDYTYQGADGGSHSFASSAVLRRAGIQAISVRDTQQTTISGTINIAVTAADLDHFIVAAPPNAQAGITLSGVNVSAQDPFGNAAAGWTSTTRCVVFSGASNAPDNSSPTYPAQGSCAAGQSQLSFDGSGVSSGFAITLVNAATTKLTVSFATKTGTSATIAVAAGPAASLLYSSATNRNGSVSITCAGPSTALTCLPASMNGNGQGRFLTANVTLVDAHQNPAPNGTGASITITLTQTGGNAVTPGSLTVLVGQATSTNTFTLLLRNGSTSATLVATVTLQTTSVSASLTTS